MKKSNVVSLESFRKQKACAAPAAKEWPKGLPDARDLWHLLDRNVSVHLWKVPAE